MGNFIPKKINTVITGAGITGISCGLFLKEKNFHDFIIFEKYNHIGGLCRSFTTKDGFTFDYAPHIIYTKNPMIKNLYQEILENAYYTKKRDAWIYIKNIYIRYPFEANTFGLPPRMIKECLMDFIDVTYRKSKRESKNFEEWILNTFGKSIAQHFMLSYNQKLWGIDLKKINCLWINNRIPLVPIEECILGALTAQRERYGHNKVFDYPSKGGIITLIHKLAEKIFGKIITSKGIEKIFWKEKKIKLTSGENIEYDNLIYTLPLFKIPKLFHPKINRDIINSISKLEWTNLVIVHFSIARPNVIEKMRVYFPQKNIIFHRLSVPKFSSQENTPPEKSSFSVEINERFCKSFPSDAELVKRVIEDLKKVNIIKPDEDIKFRLITRLKPAYVIDTPKRKEHVKKIHAFLKTNNIHPAGRFAEWEYFNMDHCILSSKNVIDEILNQNGKY